jgi:hypothetical protein
MQSCNASNICCSLSKSGHQIGAGKLIWLPSRIILYSVPYINICIHLPAKRTGQEYCPCICRCFGPYPILEADMITLLSLSIVFRVVFAWRQGHGTQDFDVGKICLKLRLTLKIKVRVKSDVTPAQRPQIAYRKGLSFCYLPSTKLYEWFYRPTPTILMFRKSYVWLWVSLCCDYFQQSSNIQVQIQYVRYFKFM